MCIVTKATAIQFYRWQVSFKETETALSGYYACVSHDMLLIPSRADTHIHMHTYQEANKNNFKKPVCSRRLHTPGLKRVWVARLPFYKYVSRVFKHAMPYVVYSPLELISCF